MTEKEEQRVCVKLCFKLEKRTTETRQMLKQAYGDAELGRTQTFEWFSIYLEKVRILLKTTLWQVDQTHQSMTIRWNLSEKKHVEQTTN